MNDLSIRPTTPALAAGAVDIALAREAWKTAIVKEIRARGARPEEAHDLWDLRQADWERCRRNNMTPAHAVSSVVGSWGDQR